MVDTNQPELHRASAPIRVGVEVVVFTIRDESLHVLLAPADTAWHLPSDLVRPDEPLDVAARRALTDVAGASEVWLEQLYTFGDVARDPHARTISVAHYALVSADVVSDHADPRAQWWPVATLPQLMLDHRRIIDYALTRLRNKLAYTTVGFQLLPQRFTLSELQRVYEIILDRELDKRNFRRKVEMLGIVKPTREQRASITGRPAQLYRFVATEAPEVIGAPYPLTVAQSPVQIARISPVLRRRGRVVPVSPSEGNR
ncbi:MAG: NUDIX hydrolase [Gemmatimonadaceae bacterium]|nr:NUDIX hydrolase [Gemmatimonadaceae bacterium]